MVTDRVKPVSRYNIHQKLEEEENKEDASLQINAEDLPNNHFTETDLQIEWKKFLDSLQTKDAVVYNAISGFRLHKEDEDTILINYPSDTAKAEFEKVSGDFFNAFKHKVNHHRIVITYKMDSVNLKKEIITKRSIFEKYVQLNPLLRDLDDLFKFDFNS